MLNKFSLIVALLLALGACKGDDKKKEEGAKAAEGSDESGGGKEADEADKFVIEQATENLAEARKKMEAGEDTDIACAAVTGYTDQLKGVKGGEKLIADAEKLCSYEAPLAILEREVKKTEEARKAAPDEKVLSECFNADYSTALDTLKGHADDPKVKELTDRFAKACPKDE